MIRHAESHLDHVPAVILEHVLSKFADRKGFFVETFRLADDLPELQCGLYGPVMGDQSVLECDVAYGKRTGRSYTSRLTNKPMRAVRECTVIAGPYKEFSCVLYTVFGGPLAPKELDDPTNNAESGRAESSAFWQLHALVNENA